MRPVLVPPAPAEQPLSATRAAELLRQAIQARHGMCLRYELGGDAVMRSTKVVTPDREEQPYPAVPPSSQREGGESEQGPLRPRITPRSLSAFQTCGKG
jgi:hypothetical protein